MHPSSEAVVDLLADLPPPKIAALYKRHGIRVVDGPTNLVRQIEADGTNWFKARLASANTNYRDVAAFVALKMGADFDETDDAQALEQALIRKFLLDQANSSDAKTRAGILETIHEFSTLYGDSATKKAATVSGAKVAGAVVAALSQKAVLEIVSKYMATLVAREAGKRLIGSINPALTVVLLGWTAYDLAGPELRLKRLVESVFEIGLLRIQYAN